MIRNRHKPSRGFDVCISVIEQVTPVPRTQDVQKVEPTVPQAEVTKQAAETAPVASPPKVDYATDLFNMLSMDGPSENSTEAATADDNSWAGFQCMPLPSL